MLKVSFRRWVLLVLMTAAVSGMASGGAATLSAAEEAAPAKTAEKAEARAPGQLTTEGLGNMLAALGVKATRTETRYDFLFAAKIGEKDADDWELSMSAVLSQDQKSLWVMAWLDELPTAAADVPKTALLRLLADNDKLGNGQFFAYITATRRFSLQRVVANENMTSEKFRDILVEQGETVAATHPHWSVAAWKAAATPTAAAPAAQASDDSKTAKEATPAATRTATKDTRARSTTTRK